MAAFINAWAEHQRKRWMRPDAERYLRPDWSSRKYWVTPPDIGAAGTWSGKSVGPDFAEEDSFSAGDLRPAQARLAHLRWLVADLKFDLALRRLARKANFNPNQPRVPAGSREGGQWTDTGGGNSGGGLGTKPAGGINDPRVISDVTPDHTWNPGAQYAQNEPRSPGSSRPDGHHFVPRSVYGDLPLPPDTRKVFDQAKTGRLYSHLHGWSQAHDEYNKAVRDSLSSFLEEHKIRPEQMTPDQARSFVDRTKRSSDPRIRGLNMRIFMREIQYWIRRGPGRNE